MPKTSDDKAVAALTAILRQVGPEMVWRPVVGPGSRLLSKGNGHSRDGLPVGSGLLDFRGRTVVDLGCNFAYYTFKVRNAGAAHVTGIDIDERVIRGCRILQRLHGVENVSFVVADVTRDTSMGPFEVGLLIDVIGQTIVARGLMDRYLDAVERLAEEEMILSVRPVYRIAKHLGGDVQGLREHYPPKYVGKRRFHTLDYIRDRFHPRWDMRVVQPESLRNASTKATLQFRRKPA